MTNPHNTSCCRWFLLRHAQPLIDEGICYGSHDIAADTQATYTAAGSFARHLHQLTGQGIHGSAYHVHVRCSPLQRCQQLARALLPLLAGEERKIYFSTEPSLAEMNFGCWEGLPWDALPSEEWERWMGDFADYKVGGGESAHMLLQRTQAVARHTKDLLAADKRAYVIWITHAGVMRALHWLQSKPEQTLPARASDWPQHGACAYGQWLCADSICTDSFAQ